MKKKYLALNFNDAARAIIAPFSTGGKTSTDHRRLKLVILDGSNPFFVAHISLPKTRAQVINFRARYYCESSGQKGREKN